MSAPPSVSTGDPAQGRGDPSLPGLIAQVAWFNRLRLLAAAGTFLISAVASRGLGLIADPAPLSLLAAATLLVDLAYPGWFPRLRGRSAAQVRRHVDLQIALDLLILTAILHFSGGVANPFILFYLFHTFIASLLLSVTAAIVVALASVLLVTGLGIGELTGILPVQRTRVVFLDVVRIGWEGLSLWLGAFAATLGLSIYFLSTILTRLRGREDELQHLNRQLALSEKLASIGTLAAGVSHEINNPVGVIQNKVQILRYRIADGDPAETLIRELDAIEKHARRIGTITQGLLTFSKETPFQLKPLELNALVEEGVDLVRVPFRNAGIELEVALDPESPKVLGSANHLLQVLVNIALNARDASRSGSVVRLSTKAELRARWRLGASGRRPRSGVESRSGGG